MQTKSLTKLINGTDGSSKAVRSKLKRKGKHVRSTAAVDKVFDWMANPVPSAHDRIGNDVVSETVVPNSDGNFDELTYVGDHALNNIQPRNMSNASASLRGKSFSFCSRNQTTP